MTKAEKLIWAAGFIDGEGYVGITRALYGKKYKHYFYREDVAIGHVSRVPLDVVAEVFGGNVRKAKDNYGHHYQWRLYGEKAVEALRLMIPYFVNKGKQAELVISFYETRMKAKRDAAGKYRDLPEEVHILREHLHAAVKALNARRSRRERLSEEAPAQSGDAIVRSHGNSNHESDAEMTSPLVN